MSEARQPLHGAASTHQTTPSWQCSLLSSLQQYRSLVGPRHARHGTAFAAWLPAIYAMPCASLTCQPPPLLLGFLLYRGQLTPQDSLPWDFSSVIRTAKETSLLTPQAQPTLQMFPLPRTAAAKPLSTSPFELQIQVPCDSETDAAAEQEETPGALTIPELEALLAALEAAGAGWDSAGHLQCSAGTEQVQQTQQPHEPEQQLWATPSHDAIVDCELRQLSHVAADDRSEGWLMLGSPLDLERSTNLVPVELGGGSEVHLPESGRVLLTQHEADTFAWLDGQAGASVMREVVQAGVEAEVMRWLNCDQEHEANPLQVNFTWQFMVATTGSNPTGSRTVVQHSYLVLSSSAQQPLHAGLQLTQQAARERIIMPTCCLLSVQASRQSHGSASDDELVPVAADLMRRLSQANSTIEAQQTEVASLQAQNQLLRQQVEQQQAQLEDLAQSDESSSARPAAWGKLVTC